MHRQQQQQLPLTRTNSFDKANQTFLFLSFLLRRRYQSLRIIQLIPLSCV